MSESSPYRRAARWAGLAAALALLNASLTFRNIWPTPWVDWTWSLSVELAACVLLLALVVWRRGQVPVRLLRLLGAVWVFLVVGHYADVTAPAIFGRPINLYWDVRHLSAVTAMLAAAASWRVVALALALLVLTPLLLYLPARWALGRLGAALAQSPERRVLVAAPASAVLLFAARPMLGEAHAVPAFGAPVTLAYGHQLAQLVDDVTSAGSRHLADSPAMTMDLSRVRDTDVFLVFIESYGAVSFDRPDFAAALAASRADLLADIEDSGRDVVSAYVESPTFGGSSWLAHISLLSGIEVRDQNTNIALMAEKRDTLVTAFSREGFRTVAMMPGLQQIWPEGAFYGFDAIYKGNGLDYRGPDFGWWSVPDQFSLARLDAMEVSPERRAPLFVFFPTISTHTPFSPVAPYQADWARVLSETPFDEAEVVQALDRQPDWMNLGPSYVRALAYDFASLGGYLRLRHDRDFVMILIGDHQPPAAVSGENAPWDVPVHVITSRRGILGDLVRRGFRPGLTPARPHISRMHELTTMLLDAFSGASEPLMPASAAD